MALANRAGMSRHPLTNPVLVSLFVLGGRALFTLRSLRTGSHLTYKVRACEDRPGLYFVSVLTGSNNEGDYSYLGTIRDGRFAHGVKSRIGQDAPSAKGFAWFWSAVSAGKIPETVECYHEGRCGRCGRTLTVPESIETGFGPECAERMGLTVRTAA